MAAVNDEDVDVACSDPREVTETDAIQKRESGRKQCDNMGAIEIVGRLAYTDCAAKSTNRKEFFGTIRMFRARAQLGQ